jgi:hypothetical protein
MNTTSVCGICGDSVATHIPSNWHPSKLRRRAEWDMAAHLRTHSFAEVLRFEIRQDLEQVPEEQRATIVRDIYRNLLGKPGAAVFELDNADSRGVYSIDEALGDAQMYALWRSSNRCGHSPCAHQRSFS